MPSQNLANTDAVESGSLLYNKISDAIDFAGGWIGFDEFMRYALYEPGMGYYTGGTAKLGEKGDFITAPLISSLFSRCIARQCQQILCACDEAEKRSIVEFGAGNGRMMVAMLSYLDSQPNCFDEYIIVETSADLVDRQQRTLAESETGLADRVRWAEDFDNQIAGVIVANELLDAIPVKRFQVQSNGKPVELGVTHSDRGFEWQVANSQWPEETASRFNHLRLGDGYRSEIGLQAESWLKTVGEKLDQGGLLLIDYGFPAEEFYHWDRVDGTLMCHYQHTAHDNPFEHIGHQDITAHVDFSAVAAAGLEVGLKLSGYASQADFLISLGILEDCEQTMNVDSDTQRTLETAQQIKKLTMPHEMGELFKAICFSRKLECSLRGFERRNQIARVLS